MNREEIALAQTSARRSSAGRLPALLGHLTALMTLVGLFSLPGHPAAAQI
jgi:hypothetical protein